MKSHFVSWANAMFTFQLKLYFKINHSGCMDDKSVFLLLKLRLKQLQFNTKLRYNLIFSLSISLALTLYVNEEFRQALEMFQFRQMLALRFSRHWISAFEWLLVSHRIYLLA